MAISAVTFSIYNRRFTFETLKQDAKASIRTLWITSQVSPNIRGIFLDKFLFTDQLKRLGDADLLYPCLTICAD